jgi:hypothetical protein
MSLFGAWNFSGTWNLEFGALIPFLSLISHAFRRFLSTAFDA